METSEETAAPPSPAAAAIAISSARQVGSLFCKIRINKNGVGRWNCIHLIVLVSACVLQRALKQALEGAAIYFLSVYLYHTARFDLWVRSRAAIHPITDGTHLNSQFHFGELWSSHPSSTVDRAHRLTLVREVTTSPLVSCPQRWNRLPHGSHRSAVSWPVYNREQCTGISSGTPRTCTLRG